MPRTRRRDTPPPRTGPAEKDVLRGFLDHLRAAVAAKAQDVPEPAVRTPGVPSGTSLLGLVRHLAHVERFTFLGEDTADWPGTFRPRPEETVDSVVADYRRVRAGERGHRRLHRPDAAGGPPRPDPAVDALGAGPHDRGDRPPRRTRRHPP